MPHAATADTLACLVAGLASGEVTVVDLSHTLDETTPVIALPEPFANTPGWSRSRLARYDDDGPAWYWNTFTVGEHVGTHFDAPVHWVTGRDGEDLSQVPAGRLVGPAVVLDRTRQAAADADDLVTEEDLRAFDAEVGLPSGGWLLLRTGWSVRARSTEEFLNADERGGHHPGLSPGAARWLAEETDLLGVGVETVGIDAGMAATFDPIFPAHHYLLGAGKYGLASLGNLDRLPVTGSVVIAAPLKMAGGSGSPARVLALMPAG